MRFLVLIFLVSASTLMAQTIWAPGYLVLTSGDTLRGRINDLQWMKSPNQVRFSQNESTEPVDYTTDEVKSFYLSNRGVTYVSFNFQFDGDMIGHYMGRFNNPTPGFPRTRLPQKWIKQSAFLQKVLGGAYSLFKFVDVEEKKHYFLLTPEQTTPEELQYHTYLVTIDGTDKLATSSYYKYQLQQVLGGCRELDEDVKRLKYTEQSLIDFIVKLNKCNGSAVSYEKSRDNNSKVFIGVVGSGSIFGFYTFDEFHLSKPKGGLGLSIEAFSKSRPDRQSFYNELKWIPYYPESAQFGPPPGDRKFQFHSIKLNTMFRVYSKNTKTYLGLGMINGVLLNLETNDGNFLNTTLPETGISIGFGHCFSSVNTSLELRTDQIFPIQASDPKVLVGLGTYGTVSLVLTKRFAFK